MTNKNAFDRMDGLIYIKDKKIIEQKIITAPYKKNSLIIYSLKKDDEFQNAIKSIRKTLAYDGFENSDINNFIRHLILETIHKRTELRNK